MINWLLQETADITASPEAWLSPAEAETLAGLRVAKRRADWLLGRWTAKRLLQRIEKERTGTVWPLAQLEIAPRPDGSPKLAQPDLPLALSISHSHGRAFCATAVGDPEQALGVDIEQIAPRQAHFLQDYFTDSEQALVAQTPASHSQRDVLTTLIWSGKEAYLKAIKKGLTVDTRTVVCVPQGSLSAAHEWQGLRVLVESTRPWQGWWRREDGFVLTMVFFSLSVS